MISRAEVEKLLEVRAAGPSLLSLYVQVPLDPAQLRGLAAHVGELFALAARDGPAVPAAVRVGVADAEAVRGLLASRGRDWLGSAPGRSRPAREPAGRLWLTEARGVLTVAGPPE